MGLVMLSASLELSGAQGTAKVPQFEQFPAEVYHGPIKIPKNLHRDSEGSWIDEGGHYTSRPKVNFAGEYYLTAHTCGTCCRYYTLDNLRTGIGVRQVGMFDTGDPTSMTKDGLTYVPVLYCKPGSMLVIVQYELDLCAVPEKKRQCRQRYFVFKDGKFQAISRTLRSCTKESNEPE